MILRSMILYVIRSWGIMFAGGVKMPYRKYSPKQGKHGPIFQIIRGISVCKNEQGKWIIKINKGGARKNKTVGEGRASLIKAIQAAEELSIKLSNQKSTTITEKSGEGKTSLVFSDYSREWLTNNAGRWRATTKERYEGILRLHILPNEWFSSKRLDEINRADVKKLLRNLFKIRSASTVETAQVVIHNIFEDAIDDQILSGNPARLILKKVLPPKRKRRESDPMPLNREDSELFLKHANEICQKPIELIFKVMLYGGFRLGEAISMRAEHLDFNKRAYQVTESYKRENFSKPKSDKFRWVDLPDFLLEELRRYILALKKEKLKQGKPSRISLLFVDPNQNEQPFSQRKIQMALRKVCLKAGIAMRSPHDLRHTYASWLLMAHQSPAYVQKQLGHSSIEITVDIYGHWVSGEGRNGLENALQPVQKPERKCILVHMSKQETL